MALSTAFETTYRRLAAAWIRHEDLASQGAAIPELFAARQQLDALRLEAARLRRTAAV